MSRPTRRDLLRWAGASAAVAAAVPLAARTRTAAAAGPAGSPRNLILVVAQGGWDTSYALDPKPGTSVDVPAGTVRRFGELDIWVDPSRANVTTFFERHAAVSAVVRGVLLSSISHPECVKRVLTGTRSETSPDLGAIVAHELGRELPLPYLVLGTTAFTGPYASSAGRVGATNQIVALLDPAQSYPVVGGGARPPVRPADEAAIRAYTEARAERERAVRGAAGYNARRVDDFVSSLQRGDDLRAVRAGFGQRGRNLDLVGQATLAMDAIAGGIARAVTLDSRITWDTHNDNAQQTQHHQDLYGDLTVIVDELAARAGSTAGRTMLDETIVVVVSEMSRTPRLNADGGKDHWPVTSALLLGGGIAGGRAYGRSTNAVEAGTVDYATGDPSPDGRVIEARNLAAGILSACGVDPAIHLPDVEPFDAFVA
jgi:hypothetical protein